MSIFISIASYCDPLLGFTIQNAYEKAKWPDKLHFGIVDQSPMGGAHPVPDFVPPKQVSYLKIEATQTRGCCWARSLAMSMVGRQDWFLQIDSHTMFEQNWDETFINKAQVLMGVTPRCVLSSYPASFEFIDGVATPTTSNQRLIAHVVAPEAAFEAGHPVLLYRAKELTGLGAVEGFHLAAGCTFSSADYVFNIPYDPYLYFNEEEASTAIRLFTHGWSIYHVPGFPLYHLYNKNDGNINRPLHWETKKVGDSAPLWVRQTYRARKRMDLLMSEDSSALGVYGLGKKRTLQDYADECGIDYIQRKLHPKAFSGPWEVPSLPGNTTDSHSSGGQT